MNQTHWKKNFDYQYTGAYELKEGEEKTVTISKLIREEVKDPNGKSQMCLVAYFSEPVKPMVLNKTNCKVIEKLYGPYIEGWIGKRITYGSAKVRAFGELVDGIKVKMFVPQSMSKADYSKAIEVLNGCKTLEELKNVYSQLTPEEKAATIKIKDELKERLTNAN